VSCLATLTAGIEKVMVEYPIIDFRLEMTENKMEFSRFLTYEAYLPEVVIFLEKPRYIDIHNTNIIQIITYQAILMPVGLRRCSQKTEWLGKILYIRKPNTAAAF
jgi:hypothetical protein